MSRHLILSFLLIFSASLFAGCLNPQSKEYRFTIRPDGTGEGVITFVNIVSQNEDDNDVSLKDFGILMNDYLDGTTWEDQNPAYRVTSKRLYEENNMLMGEVKFTFSNLDSVGFISFPGCNCAPLLFSMSALSETFAGTNGKFRGDSASPSFLYWEPDAKECIIRTTVIEDTSGTRSLLTQWKHWKELKK
ncbi:hypothetical protein EHM69_09500 [candidate division KSB1 bacterium]|nr:MAG: hypothetical protein EHM69_09500 [candidate division KSB1 bacterium]